MQFNRKSVFSEKPPSITYSRVINDHCGFCFVLPRALGIVLFCFTACRWHSFFFFASVKVGFKRNNNNNLEKEKCLLKKVDF